MESAAFTEIKLFQVKPDKVEAFESLIRAIAPVQRERPGCVAVRYMKRFYTIDGVTPGDPPRELSRVVKCVKYYSYWEFDSKESYGKAIAWFFSTYYKDLQRLLIMPFDISCGDTVA